MAGLRVGAEKQLYLSKNSSKAAAGQRVLSSSCSLAQKSYQQYLPPALARAWPRISITTQEVLCKLSVRACPCA